MHTRKERIYFMAINRMHMRNTAEKEGGEISLYDENIVEE